MEKRWIMAVGNIDGLAQKGVELVLKEVSRYLPRGLATKTVSDIDKKDLAENNLIIIGKSGAELLSEYEDKGVVSVAVEKESFSIFVGENLWNSELQAIVIDGFDEKGVLYGCVDFCNKYLGYALFNQGQSVCLDDFFDSPFSRPLPKFSFSVSPAIKTRAIWTWGHVIYDYKGFFDNMLTLKLNEVVIWNDFAPLNASEVVEYAHSLGIKVVWGFAWGWTQKCEDFIKDLTEEKLKEIKAQVLKTYAEEYKGVGDGIYFQSFTELHKEEILGKCVAEIVTDFVNDTAAALFEENPKLNIQFGLHATSVKNNLKFLKKVDKRIRIVWEDCGAFPYSYDYNRIGDFDKTMELTEELLSLRGQDEAFGAVLKGMINLDWTRFEHYSDNIVLGKHSKEFILDRQKQKNRAWRIVQAAWLKNGDYAKRAIELIAKKGKDPVVELLVEDAMFENDLPFTVALMAEILWTPSLPIGEIIAPVSCYPKVKFANLT